MRQPLWLSARRELLWNCSEHAYAIPIKRLEPNLVSEAEIFGRRFAFGKLHSDRFDVTKSVAPSQDAGEVAEERDLKLAVLWHEADLVNELAVRGRRFLANARPVQFLQARTYGITAA
jgi:hypothetical protein